MKPGFLVISTKNLGNFSNGRRYFYHCTYLSNVASSYILLLSAHVITHFHESKFAYKSVVVKSIIRVVSIIKTRQNVTLLSLYICWVHLFGYNSYVLM